MVYLSRLIASPTPDTYVPTVADPAGSWGRLIMWMTMKINLALILYLLSTY